jgi:hypothetical protein
MRGNIIFVLLESWLEVLTWREAHCKLGAGYSRSGVGTVLSVNSLSWYVEVESRDLTLCSQVMVELKMRKREVGDGDGRTWEDMGNQGYDEPDQVW